MPVSSQCQAWLWWAVGTHRTQEVGGSSPPGSIAWKPCKYGVSCSYGASGARSEIGVWPPFVATFSLEAPGAPPDTPALTVIDLASIFDDRRRHFARRSGFSTSPVSASARRSAARSGREAIGYVPTQIGEAGLGRPQSSPEAQDSISRLAGVSATDLAVDEESLERPEQASGTSRCAG